MSSKDLDQNADFEASKDQNSSKVNEDHLDLENSQQKDPYSSILL